MTKFASKKGGVGAGRHEGIDQCGGHILGLGPRAFKINAEGSLFRKTLTRLYMSENPECQLIPSPFGFRILASVVL